jgi:hypothetical protein
LKYNEYGFLDQLHRKWYGRVHCLESSALTKPKPLTVRAVAGVFMMLGLGLVVGIMILLSEHFMFKYFLPSLRKKPKDCFWKSPNLMFFSQVCLIPLFSNAWNWNFIFKLMNLSYIYFISLLEIISFYKYSWISFTSPFGKRNYIKSQGRPDCKFVSKKC